MSLGQPFVVLKTRLEARSTCEFNWQRARSLEVLSVVHVENSNATMGCVSQGSAGFQPYSMKDHRKKVKCDLRVFQTSPEEMQNARHVSGPAVKVVVETTATAAAAGSARLIRKLLLSHVHENDSICHSYPQCCFS
jgi:hypothetical protein